MAVVKRYLDFIWDIFYPKSCIACGVEGDWVCINDRKLLVAHPRFECPVCHRDQSDVVVCASCKNNSHLNGLWVVTQYHNPIIESLIKLLKYQYLTDLAEPIKELIISYKPHVVVWDSSIVLVPVPLYWRRWCERGFNQAEIVANLVHEVFGNPIDSRLLERTYNHHPQARLNAQKRLTNITGGFRARRTGVIPQKVILIDDVCTTGATLEACAQALKAVGVQEIWAMVIARG